MRLIWDCASQRLRGGHDYIYLSTFDKLRYTSSMKKSSLVTCLMVILRIVISFPIFITYAENKHSATATINYEQLKEPLSQLIRNEMKRNDVVGLSSALVDDQLVVWARGFGYADEKKMIAAAPNTVHGIGSLTKLFTTAAALQLV